jgi:phosphoglycolate phosphatase-like HAD superfamily hydrolase
MRVVEPVVSIFDVEGTLMDSVPLQLESWRATLNAAGHTCSWADLQAFSGMDGTWMLDQLLPKESQETKHRLLKAQGDCYRTHFLLRARPFPGVRGLFERLKQRDKCLAKLQVADSSCAVSIGDTPYDAKAAKQLGMFAAGVITGGFSEQALRESGCDCVFERVPAVDAIWSGSQEPLIFPTTVRRDNE